MSGVDEPSDFERFACPGCTEAIDVPAESAGKLVRCPYCNTHFFASAEQADQPVVDDTTPESTDIDRESAFNKLRIANYTALRMGAIRARSWWLIAMVLAILIVLDMMANAALYVAMFHRWGVWPTLRVVIGVLCTKFAAHAWRRAAALHREISKSAIPEPTTPPDFSTLDDGSDRLKQLENIR
jgi:hypothetical protein